MSQAEPGRQHYNLTLAVLALAALSYALLQTMVAPALPEIQKDVGATTTQVTWVLTVYLLTASVATPVLGRLGDIFGKERVLVLVLIVFALGTLVSALSHTLALLVAGRAIQGAAGAVFPLAFGIIRDEFPREKVATGIGLISATFGIGGGAGLILSGVIVDHLSYEWIFWFGFVVISIAVVTTHFFVPESPVKTPARIDWIGAALMSAGLVCLLLGVSEGNSWGWGSARVIGLFASAGALLVAWVLFERRVPQPLVDMKLLSLRGVWTTNLVGLLLGFGMFGSFILIPQFVQVDDAVAGFGFNASVTEAGLFMLPSTLVMLIAGPASGVLSNRFGSRLPLLMGVAVAAVSFAVMAFAHSQPWEIVVATVLMGAGIGLSFASMANLIVDAVPQAQTGEATGINTIMRTVGGAIGGQVAASIVAAHVTIGGVQEEQGFTLAFLMGTIALAVGFLAGLLIPRRGALVAPVGARPAEARPGSRA